jgi:hypothetical protein
VKVDELPCTLKTLKYFQFMPINKKIKERHKKKTFLVAVDGGHVESFGGGRAGQIWRAASGGPRCS